MTWEDWLSQNLPAGTRETSGYRSPQQEAALGGPATSYHSTGSPSAPGAIDVGGPAAQLKALFDTIRQQFAGRINELYLNIPGGQSQDIKNNQPIGVNPEAGRAQHLHIAIGGQGGPGPAQTPFEAAMDRFLKGIPTPAPPGVIPAPGSAIGGAPAAQSTGAECDRKVCVPFGSCTCWSDVWVYGAGLLLIIVGLLMISRRE